MIVTLIASAIPVDPNKTPPREVEQLLKMFPSVHPIEEPRELPSLRQIQHQIDFTSRANLPNLSHYRMGPKETEALQDIVKELLAKQLI